MSHDELRHNLKRTRKWRNACQDLADIPAQRRHISTAENLRNIQPIANVIAGGRLPHRFADEARENLGRREVGLWKDAKDAGAEASP